MESNPTLAEIQGAIYDRLVAILSEAQAKVREAQKLLTTIPAAYRQNGLKGSLDMMNDRLDKADDLFTGAYKSVEDTYGSKETP